MSELKAHRDGDEFVVESEDGEAQRIDMTSVMHRVDQIAFRRYSERSGAAPEGEDGKLEAAIEIAKEKRDAKS